MKQIKRQQVIKILILLVVTVLIVGIIAYLLPLMKQISTREGQIYFKEKIHNLGFLGMLMLFLLQLAQIMLVVLPGEPIEILAGMCYGSIGGMFFIFASVFITTSLIYVLVKKLGKTYIYQSFSKEKIDKIENSKAFKNPQTIEMVLIILFLIPGTPKDLLTYIGALLPIKFKKFILIATFARFPSVISSTIVGANIVQARWELVVIVYAVTFLLTGIMIFVTKKLDKNKVAKDAMDILK